MNEKLVTEYVDAKRALDEARLERDDYRNELLLDLETYADVKRFTGRQPTESTVRAFYESDKGYKVLQAKVRKCEYAELALRLLVGLVS